MSRKKYIIQIIILLFLLIFSIYELVFLGINLYNYQVGDMSPASIITGIVLFSIIIGSVTTLLIICAIREYRRKYYLLKK